MALYCIEQRKKYISNDFCHLQEINQRNVEKKLSDTAKKTAIDATKTASKKVVHKTAEATGELTGNKIAEKKVKPKPVPDNNSKNVEEVSPSERRQEILNK